MASFRNYPVAGIADLIRGTAPAAHGNNNHNNNTNNNNNSGMLPYTGVAYSYVWWMVCFQLVVGVLLTAAAATTPKLRLSALALVTVLTTSCFLLSESVCNATYGVYMFTHNESGTAASVLKTDSGAQHTINAVITLFSGCIVCSVANALSLVFLGMAASPASEETPAPKAAETVATPVAAEEAPAAAAESV